MAERALRIQVNIATPRFAWYMAGQCSVSVNGIRLPRVIRAAYLYLTIRRMKRNALSQS